MNHALNPMTPKKTEPKRVVMSSPAIFCQAVFFVTKASEFEDGLKRKPLIVCQLSMLMMDKPSLLFAHPPRKGNDLARFSWRDRH